MNLVLCLLVAGLWQAPAASAPDGGVDGSLEAAADPAVPAPPPIEQALRQCREALRAGQFERALQECNAALRLDPNRVEAMLAKTRALLALGDGRSALAPARMATSLAPDSAEAFFLLGQAYLHDLNQDYPRAEEALRKAAELDPVSRDVRLSLAKALSFQKRVEEAIAELRLAHERHPDDTAVMVKLAESYYVLRKLDLAERYIKEALEKNPADPDALRVQDQVRSRQSYNFWVILLAAIIIPSLWFGIRWLKRGRVVKEQ